MSALAATLPGAALARSWDAVPLAWNAEPAVVGCLAATSLLYAGGVLRLRSEHRWPTAGPARVWAFAAGIVLLVVALLSPLDAWSEASFAAHMGQHLILMMVAPPLLLLGRPIVTALWALPQPSRQRVARWWRRSHTWRPAIDFVRSPLVAWPLASLALWFWHLPKPYERGLHDPVAHASEHLSFFFSAILFWRVVIEDPQSRRLSLGATMLFVATFAMQTGMLGAILIFAPRVLYSDHAIAPAWSALSALEDQQLAGVLMWLVTGVIDLTVLGVLFVAWLASSERRALRR